jgi:hypothetical protein
MTSIPLILHYPLTLHPSTNPISFYPFPMNADILTEILNHGNNYIKNLYKETEGV